jgi:hypothetical protein
MADRYLRIVLTVIAIELAWIGLKDVVSTPVAAQPAVTPVVIRGFDAMAGVTPYIPVAIAGQVSVIDARVRPLTTRVEAGERALRVDISGTVNSRIIDPIRVDTSPSNPLDVKSVQAGGASRPGL